jgi:hypothetical protein
MGFTFDHEVLTEQGWIPISDLTTDHNVAVLLNGEQLAYKPVVDIQQTDIQQEVIRIVSDVVDLETTYDHPLYVSTVLIKPEKLETVHEGEEPSDSEEVDEKQEVDVDTPAEQVEDTTDPPRIGLLFKNNALLVSDLYDKEHIEQAIEAIVKTNRVPTEFLLNFNKDQSRYLISLIFQNNISILANTKEFANDLSIIALNAGLATYINPQDIVLTEDDITKPEAKPDAPAQPETPVEEAESKAEDDSSASENDTEQTRAELPSPEPGVYTLVTLIQNSTPLITEDNIQKDQYNGPVYEITSSEDSNIVYVRRNGKPVWIYGKTLPEKNDVEQPVEDVSESVPEDLPELEEVPVEDEQTE